MSPTTTRKGSGAVYSGGVDTGQVITYPAPITPGQLMATLNGIVVIPPPPRPGPRYGSGMVLR
jgi:hypothetical protein